MKLIIGLGNPDRKYENTRHNIGFDILDFYAEEKAGFLWKKRNDALYNEIYSQGVKIILLKPQKYMNLSGVVVKEFIDYFKINIEDILVIHDDLDLLLGRIKLTEESGAAGHNGVKNIEEALCTKKYKRVRVGVSNEKSIDTKKYVLGKFDLDEKEKIETVKKTVSKIIDEFTITNFLLLINEYNKKNV